MQFTKSILAYFAVTNGGKYLLCLLFYVNNFIDKTLDVVNCNILVKVLFWRDKQLSKSAQIPKNEEVYLTSNSCY